LPIKILKKNDRKKYFLANVFNKFARKILCNIKISNSAVGVKSVLKFESGYSVESVFDGCKLGIEPYAVEVLPEDDLLILDSINSRISSMLSLCKCARLIGW